MKTFQITVLALVAPLLMATQAQASASSDLNGLGGNAAVIKKAKRFNSNNKVRIVQNRLVDRDLRLELGATYGPVANGSSYLSTQQYGGQLEFHIIPQVSIGARYLKSANSFTAEGQRMYDAAKASPGAPFPDIDRPEEQWLATATWYMLYGKLNMFDAGITQFDIYSIAGAGQIKLANSGVKPTFTAGAGVGFWWSKHFSSRLEARWQGYQDTVASGSRQQNTIVAQAGIGILL